MDPSTQRMLERARARRQKLDEQLKNAGQETVHKRSPLHESNKSQFVKVTTEVEVVLSSPDPVKRVNVSPTKVEVCGEKQKENVNQTYSTQESKSNSLEDVDNRERNIRSQLKRLGALYSDSQLSSPIHRTENKFAIEDDVAKSHKSSARVARLAALADNIKQWEDDLSHPNLGLRTEDIPSPDKSPQKLPELSSCKKKDEETITVKKPEEKHKDNKTNYTKLKHPLSSQPEQCVAPKKIIWDEKVLQILDSSEETTRKAETSVKPASNDFMQKHRSVKATGERIAVSIAKKPLESSVAPSVQSSTSPLKRITEEKIEPKPESPTKMIEGNSGAGKPMGSPRRGLVSSPKAGSVLHKASLFESTSPTKKVKDPAELPIFERMALFERNKGQALIPKAAFSMPVPPKYLESNESKKNGCPSSPEKGKLPGKLNISQRALNLQLSTKCTQDKQDCNATESNVSKNVSSCRSIFEQLPSNKACNQVLNEQSERQKDLDMLRNRWNKNKNITSEQTKSEEKIIPAPPPLPSENSVSPMRNSVSSLPQVTQMIPKSSPSKNLGPKVFTSYDHDLKKPESPKKTRDYSDICKVKKIRVSPPKPGKLYPCLSDIEATTTETESEVPETEHDSAGDSSIVTDSDDGNTSFGREILEAAGIHNQSENQRQISLMDSSDSDSDKLSESAVLADIDGCIDEALEGYDSSSDSDQEGPTPPKRTRDYSRSPPKGRRNSKQSPNSMPSQSFRFTPGDHSNYSSPEKSPSKRIEQNVPMQVVEGDKEMPLLHSVSFYRRQQNMAVKTPVKQIVRPPEIIYEKQSEPTSQNEEEAVRKKISELLDEVTKQQTVISQASQALNLCMSTVEFSGSAEQVEGERLLLLATHKRQAALHEIQRLKVEGSLKPVSDVAVPSSSFDKGSLLLLNIALTLKKDYVRKLSTEDTCYHFVCLVRYQEQVLVTKVIAATSQNLKDNCNLEWDSPLRLVDLYSDFKVTLEVYSLQSRREILPHNVKYHIGNKKDTGKSWLTPKKHKQDSRLLMPSIHSPAGPSAVRSPEFRMAGYVVFSLREISRTHFTLNKVSYSSPLEGNIQLKMKSELSVDVSERGFLTMFEDVSGFGAWHRRWFVLKGSSLAYWKYPDDEKKVPIGQIDLNACITEQIGLVSRDICARPNTFLLETARAVQHDDKDSLVLVKCKDRTIIRNLLSADTKEERLVWCSQLNKALTMIRAWGKFQDHS